MDESPKFGRYEIIERLGKGGMGVIYKAHDTQLDRVVALKTILPDFLSSPEVKERLIREAQAAARLQHPNVVTIFDIGESEDKRLYFAMEYVRGRSLREVIPMRLPLERRLEIMADVCKALDFAHQHGIIHRDVKPTNVLLAEDGTVKLFDFGIAHLAGSSLTRTGVAIGTPEYMSPEMVEGGDLDARSDIFSCGVMLYEMLTRNNPFRSDRVTTTMYRIVHSEPSTLRALRPNLPEDLEAILAKMLAKNPVDRYSKMAEVVDDLEHIVSRGLLHKAIRAKELGDLMEKVEAKVSAAESDPQARKLLEDKMAVPLSRRRRQVRKIAKAADTSVTATLIDRELLSLRKFEERLDQFLEEVLPQGAKGISSDDVPTADLPAAEPMPPEIQDTAATMRWEGDTIARQGMAAALSEKGGQGSESSGEGEAAGPPAERERPDSADPDPDPAPAAPSEGETGAGQTPPPPPPASSLADESTGPGVRPSPQAAGADPATAQQSGREAQGGGSGEARESAQRPRDSETEPTIVVPASGARASRGWLIPASLVAVVLVAALAWLAVGLWTSEPEQSAQEGGDDPAQEASLQDDQESAAPPSDTSPGATSSQAGGGGGTEGAGPAQGPSGGSGSPGGQGNPPQGSSASPSAPQGSSAGSAQAADDPSAPSSYTFQVTQTNARKGLIAGNRDCAGTLEVRAEMIRFRSEECTSRTLVGTILQDTSLEEGLFTIRQTNGTSYTFNIASEDRSALRQALADLGW